MDISIKNVCKSYGELEVLKNISLDIAAGDFVAVMGPSGSGKSTLLYAMGLLESINGGEIFFDGINVATIDDKTQSAVRLKKIGFIFQFYNLMPELNVEENILLPYLMLSKKEKDKNKREQLEPLLAELGLTDKRHSKINTLSGGQQQRVAVARALFNDAEVILADEPTGNLDSKSAVEIMGLLKKLNEEQGKTVVLVTHDIKMAKYARTRVNLSDGEIV